MDNLSNENVIHIKRNGMEYLQFKKLLDYGDFVNHAYTLGLNRNYRTARAGQFLPEEEYNKAISDYKDLAEAVGINYKDIIKPNQAHTKNIKIIDNKINLNDPDFNMKEYNETDGLITKERNFVLATTNADCILMLFFDPVKKVIANVHSGWKGTLQRISVEIVRKMKLEFECNPNDVICCICPSIRKCHFCVHKDVQELYYNEFSDIKEINSLIVPIEEGKTWSIDTVEINKVILEQAGLNRENIIDSNICSVCNCDKIHSYRVEKENYGLETAIIELK